MRVPVEVTDGIQRAARRPGQVGENLFFGQVSVTREVIAAGLSYLYVPQPFRTGGLGAFGVCEVLFALGAASVRGLRSR